MTLKIEDVPEKTVRKKNTQVKETVKNWEITGLPSRGITYGGAKLYGRPLNTLEVKKLATINEENYEDVIDAVLRSVLTGIPYEDILSTDKFYCIFWLRAQTFIDEGFAQEYTCIHCKKKTSYLFSIESMEVQSLTEDFTESDYTFTSPITGDEIVWHFATIADQLKVRKFKEDMKKIAPNMDSDLLGLASQIDTINGKRPMLEEKYQYLYSNPQNFAVILSYLSKYSCGLQEDFKVKCNLCGGLNPMGISFRTDFMLPEYKFRRDTE